MSNIYVVNRYVLSLISSFGRNNYTNSPFVCYRFKHKVSDKQTNIYTHTLTNASCHSSLLKEAQPHGHTFHSFIIRMEFLKEGDLSLTPAWATKTQSSLKKKQTSLITLKPLSVTSDRDKTFLLLPLTDTQELSFTSRRRLKEPLPTTLWGRTCRTSSSSPLPPFLSVTCQPCWSGHHRVGSALGSLVSCGQRNPGGTWSSSLPSSAKQPSWSSPARWIFAYSQTPHWPCKRRLGQDIGNMHLLTVKENEWLIFINNFFGNSTKSGWKFRNKA